MIYSRKEVKRMGVKLSKKRINAILNDRGWKVTDLAEKAGLSWSTVYRALDGKEFNSGTLEKISDALNVNPIDLLDVGNDPAPLVGAPSIAIVAA
jgi:DNA-binding Xre family transcriptional regulator